MSVVKSEINTYLSAKRLIQAQIWKEEKCIEECTEEINSYMKIDYVRLEIKLGRKNHFINENQMAIIRHKMNIERLKTGDIEFLFELILKEQKAKQSPLNSLIVELLDILEEQVECKQHPEMYKTEAMSMDDFYESCNEGIKKTKNNIERLLEGDLELYNVLERAMYKRKYTD